MRILLIFLSLFSAMKVLSTVLNLILLAVIANLVVDIFYDGLIYRSQTMAIPQANDHKPSSEKRVKPGPLADYQVIIKRDFFKTRNVDKPQMPALAVESLETTDLDVKLWGTVTGKGAGRYAVIETLGANNRPQQQLLREGDTIATATIEKILRDKVILDLNGNNQVLPLEEFQLQGRTRIKKIARNRRPIQQRRILKRSMIDNAMNNVNQLVGQAKIIPHREGLLIKAIKPGSLFKRLGLRNGDVITGVNGRAIRSVDDALAFYAKLKNAPTVSVQLKRRGQERSMQYVIR